MNDNFYVKITDVSIRKAIMIEFNNIKGYRTNRLFNFEKQIGLKYHSYLYDPLVHEGASMRIYQVKDKSKFIFAVMKYGIQYSNLQ